jgi:hypothetical protein
MTQDRGPTTWSHSFEEDDDAEVYRPTDSYAFPPSRRGRRVLRFDGEEITELSPGPDDRLRVDVRWQPAGTNRFRSMAMPGDQQIIEVVERTPDMLKVRRHR